jgi:hypothetical protein
MKTILAALVAAFSCLGLVACGSEGSTGSIAVTTTSTISAASEAQALATNVYTTICVGSSGNPPLSAAVDTLTASGTVTLNATQSALYAAIQKDCSYGAPTTAAGILLWTVTLIATVEKQFPQIKIRL